MVVAYRPAFLYTMEGPSASEGQPPGHSSWKGELPSNVLATLVEDVPARNSDLAALPRDPSRHGRDPSRHGRSSTGDAYDNDFYEGQGWEDGAESGRGTDEEESDVESANSTGSMSSWTDDDEDDHGAFVEFIVRRIDVPQKTWLSLPESSSIQAHKAMPPRRRSIFGLPLIPPYHPVCLAWLGGMLLFDVIFTVRGVAPHDMHALSMQPCMQSCMHACMFM